MFSVWSLLPSHRLDSNFPLTDVTSKFQNASRLHCGVSLGQLCSLWDSRLQLQVPAGSVGGMEEHRDASFKELLDIMLCR